MNNFLNFEDRIRLKRRGNVKICAKDELYYTVHIFSLIYHVY